jgi:hypothetical protein
MKYQAVRSCLYHGKRFKVGDFLPEGWEPIHHFKPLEEAQKQITKDRMIKLGIKPKVNRGAKKAIKAKADQIRNDANLDIPETPALNFLTATEKDLDGYTRKQLADQILDQYDVGLNIDGRSKADIVKKGIEIALEKKKDEN